MMGQFTEHQYAQQEAEHRAGTLQVISDLAIECSAAAPNINLYKIIAEKLQAITGALGVSISEYDPKEQVLITRYVSVSGEVLSHLNDILGQNIIGLRSPVSPEMYQQIFKEIVALASDLNEVSFGGIPKSISAIVQAAFRISGFTGLGFIYEGKLWGTAVITTQKDHPLIDQELATTIANVATMALHRQKTEEALQASEARYRAL